MKQISEELVESLKKLGMTEYEAKVYSTLVLLDKAEVKQIYEYLDLPRPSVYQVLKSLMDRGLVQTVNVRPAMYRATSPSIAISHMVKTYGDVGNRALSELEELERSRIEVEKSDAIWTIYGEKSIELTLEEMVDKAEKSVKLMLPDDRFYLLGSLADKKVDVELIMFNDDASALKKYGLKRLKAHNALDADFSDFAPMIKYFSKLPLPPEQYKKFIMIIIDDADFMYVPPFPSQAPSGVMSKNAFFIALASGAFEMVWEHTPLIYP